MDALFALNRAGFQQLVAHVSLYHNDPTPGMQTFVRETLSAAGLQPNRYVLWDVKGMGQLLGKALPLDIHGSHVIFDERALATPEATHGMLKYGFLAAAVRARSGGRWRYDYLTMNGMLALGTVAGLAFLKLGQRRWTTMQRRPVLAIFASLGVAVFAMGAFRAAFKIFNIGMLVAEKSHEQALHLMPCADCIADVLLTSEKQIEEMSTATLPQPQPGMPPPPEEYVKAWKRGMETQVMLVQRDVLRMRLLYRRAGDTHCAVHEALRRDPVNFAVTEDGYPVFERDRELARGRAAGEFSVRTDFTEEERKELQRLRLELR